MNDAVFDTTVVAFANSDIAARRAGNVLDNRLGLLEKALNGRLHIRYNGKLLGEYVAHVSERRNDVIELFFALLDSGRTTLVRKNTLSRQNYRIARDERWPTHDQHLLAAALDGENPEIYVTEAILANCDAGIYRVFRIHVRQV